MQKTSCAMSAAAASDDAGSKGTPVGPEGLGRLPVVPEPDLPSCLPGAAGDARPEQPPHERTLAAKDGEEHEQKDCTDMETADAAIEDAAPVDPPLLSVTGAGYQAPPDSTVPEAKEADRPEDDLVGHVISVAGSVVWGVFDASSCNTVEIGGIVRLSSNGRRSFGAVTALKRDGRRQEDERRMVEIKLLGEIPPGSGSFQCGVTQHPALDSPIHIASRDELRMIFQRPEVPTVRLGTLRHAEDLPAFAITDTLLSKHFAVLGTTGAGKSCAVTVLLRAILDANPFGHIIMLDPHNEYGRAFGDRAELLSPANFKLPYWLLNFEEIVEILVTKNAPDQAYAEAAILRDAILRARRAGIGDDSAVDHLTVDTPSPYRLSDLLRILREQMGAFNKVGSIVPYQHLIGRIESIAADRRFEFMFSSFMVQDTMAQVLGRILRIPVGSRPVTIFDLSGMPSEILDVVVSVLCRLIFEFALWSERSKAPPTLLVCEEAHRYVPRDDQMGFAPTKRAIARIAKEGRKYGLSLCLVTQRPAELSISSLSQCNTIFALRMANEHDLAFVQHAIPESSRWLTDAMSSLNTREAVVIGAGVSIPMHVRFDELEPEHRPESTSPPFSDAWQREVVGQGLIEATIHRWRHQVRGLSQTG